MISPNANHLGSPMVATNASGGLIAKWEFLPFGAVRSGGINQTSLNYTGQQRDGTGLLYYHARYYDPALARFISADSVVPGAPDGSTDGTAIKPLTVDFHEPGFVGSLTDENQQPFWFQMGEEERAEASAPWGPPNPQALNRYAYVQNNPLKYTDPSGHWIESAIDVASLLYDIHMIRKEGWTRTNTLALGADVIGTILPFAGGLGIILRAGKGAKIYTQVTIELKNPVLKNIIASLFQDSDKILGGTAGLIQHERRNGLPVTHVQKAYQEISWLQKLLKGKHGVINAGERAFALKLLRDLQDAVRGLKRPPMH